jgi:hypothetical protein
LGRRYGTRAVRRIPGAARRLEQAMGFLDRFGVVFVLSFRFAYGIRNVAAAACGVAGMNWARFAALNFIAAGLWAATFVASGWFVAQWLGDQAVCYVLGGLGVVIVGVLVAKMIRRRPAPREIEPITRTGCRFPHQHRLARRDLRRNPREAPCGAFPYASPGRPDAVPGRLPRPHRPAGACASLRPGAVRAILARRRRRNRDARMAGLGATDR